MWGRGQSLKVKKNAVYLLPTYYADAQGINYLCTIELDDF
jgi:hypothetical protein